jgi:hypothetical protein
VLIFSYLLIFDFVILIQDYSISNVLFYMLKYILVSLVFKKYLKKGFCSLLQDSFPRIFVVGIFLLLKYLDIEQGFLSHLVGGDYDFVFLTERMLYNLSQIAYIDIYKYFLPFGLLDFHEKKVVLCVVSEEIKVLQGLVEGLLIKQKDVAISLKSAMEAAPAFPLGGSVENKFLVKTGKINGILKDALEYVQNGEYAQFVQKTKNIKYSLEEIRVQNDFVHALNHFNERALIDNVEPFVNKDELIYLQKFTQTEVKGLLAHAIFTKDRYLNANLCLSFEKRLDFMLFDRENIGQLKSKPIITPITSLLNMKACSNYFVGRGINFENITIMKGGHFDLMYKTG